MKYAFRGYVIEYEYHRGIGRCILFLHGWGGNLHSFDTMLPICKDREYIAISFPPYLLNESVLPLTMKDYVDIVNRILQLHNQTSVIVISHSFGTRIAMLLDKKIIKALVITCGAGIKPLTLLHKLSNQHKILCNLHGANYTIGSKDYISLGKVDQHTFRNIVKIDCLPNARFVSCPTLIYWGKKDKQTPMYMAKLWHKLIKSSKLVVVDSDHFAYIHHSEHFNYITKKFLEEI